MKNYIHRTQVFRIISILVWISLQFNFTSYSQEIFTVPLVNDSVCFKNVKLRYDSIDRNTNNIYVERHNEFIYFISKINGKRNGLTYQYREKANGKYDLTQIIYYKDNVPDLFALFFNEGKLKSICLEFATNTKFIDDKKNAGNSITYQMHVFSSLGRLAEVGYCISPREGAFTGNHSTRVGEWIYYNEDGSVKEKKYYNLHDYKNVQF